MSAEVRTTTGADATTGEAGAGYIQISLDNTLAPTPSKSATRSPPRDKSPEARAHIRDLCTKARNEADRLWSASKNDRDAMFGPTTKLSDVLDRLWNLRSYRDENWIGILDQARIAIQGLASNDGGIEAATEDQCWNLLKLVDEHLTSATKTVVDLIKAVEIVSAMGLDPYSGLGSLGGTSEQTKD